MGALYEAAESILQPQLTARSRNKPAKKIRDDKERIGHGQMENVQAESCTGSRKG